MEMNHYLIKNTKKDNSFKTIVGGILIIMGLASISYYVGYIFLLMAIFIIAFNSGTEFDLKNNKVRQFYSFFNVKKGEWINLSHFKAITIKHARKGYRTNSRSNTSSVDTVNSRYEVYLVAKKRSETIMLYDSRNRKQSKSIATTCAEKTGFIINTYGA